MKSISTFQIIVTTAFVVFTIIGVGVFAAFGGVTGSTSVGQVAIWGTQDAVVMDTVLQNLRSADKSFQDVTYLQLDEATYEKTIINAIAAGRGPDLFFMTQENIGAFVDKVTTIPYSAVSQSTYVNSFIDESNVFLNNQGSWALPFTIDPLVMYWNRDLLAGAGVAQAPLYWNDFLTLAQKLTSIDASQNVRRSAVALGAWGNVSNAKAILSALFMQAGDPIVGRNSEGGLASVFGITPPGLQTNPAESALRFYTEFANPSKSSYTWNRSLHNSTEAFVAGDLAVYFGFASEMGTLAKRNPNLHFSVAVLPQLQGNGPRLTYGRVTGLAISRAAANAGGALAIAQKLVSQASIQQMVAATGLPAVRRDVAVDTASNAAALVFSQSALISRGWFDPNTEATNAIFKAMVESVTTGKSDPSQAAVDAAQEFIPLFNQ